MRVLTPVADTEATPSIESPSSLKWSLLSGGYNIEVDFRKNQCLSGSNVKAIPNEKVSIAIAEVNLQYHTITITNTGAIEPTTLQALLQ